MILTEVLKMKLSCVVSMIASQQKLNTCMREGSDWMDGYKLALLFEKQKKKALYFSHPLQIKVRKQTNKQKDLYHLRGNKKGIYLLFLIMLFFTTVRVKRESWSTCHRPLVLSPHLAIWTRLQVKPHRPWRKINSFLILVLFVCSVLF